MATTASSNLAILSSPVFPTASHADRRREGRTAPTRREKDRDGSNQAFEATTHFPQQQTFLDNIKALSPTYQPSYPAAQSPSNNAAENIPPLWSVKKVFSPTKPTPPLKALPFPARIRRPSTSRLWNPSNSTPRLAQAPVTLNTVPPSIIRDLPPKPIPLSHPQLSPSYRQTERPDDHPLLTLPQQHAKRNSYNERTSLQVELSGSPSTRISLPRSVSVELSRRTPTPILTHSPPSNSPESQKQKATGYRKRGQSVSNTTGARESAKVDYKGKGKEVDRGDVQTRSFHDIPIAMETSNRNPSNDANKDIETGNHTHIFQPSGFPNINSNASATSLSAGSGIGAALNSPALTNASSSAVGSDHGDNSRGAEVAWGPNHPCYPHLNPHVPLNSPLYRTTRIIRIRRDWLMEGDLAPTFSNLYPEILEPAGLTEQEFRKLISHVNQELVPAFNPFAWRNILDSVLGLLTGWVWDDLGASGIKRRLQGVERWLEEWNERMEKNCGEAEGVRVVPLRRTGYMNLDIQIPDPVFTENESERAPTTQESRINEQA